MKQVKCKNQEKSVAGVDGVNTTTVKTNQAELDFLTIPESAALIRISVSKLQKMILAREITFCQPKPKGKITIPRSVLLEYQYAGLVPTMASIADNAVSKFVNLNQKGAA
jgi:hypothetical protein